MFITFLNLIKKRKELHQPLAIRIYKSCNYVFTLQGSKNNIYTFSTKSLVGAYVSYIFFCSVVRHLQKKEKESTVFSEQFSEHSTCKKLNKIKNEISELLIACNVHRKTNYDTILRSLWWFWSVFRFRIESLHMKHKSGTTSDTLLV